MPRIYSFPPVANAAARILILGSMPGQESLRAGQYYAHPRNCFWKLMGEFFGAGSELTYARRTLRLKKSGIALWDVLACCARTGSLDSAIDVRSMVPNDFPQFFSTHPRIRAVFFNGTTAERCFRMRVQPQLDLPLLQFERLPSTSPAHAARSYAQKRTAWQAVARRAAQSMR